MEQPKLSSLPTIRNSAPDCIHVHTGRISESWNHQEICITQDWVNRFSKFMAHFEALNIAQKLLFQSDFIKLSHFEALRPDIRALWNAPRATEVKLLKKVTK